MTKKLENRLQVITTLIGLAIFINGFSQGQIILNNEQKIDFESFKQKDNHLVVKKKKEKQIIAAEDVKGYFENYENIFYHRKPVVNSTVMSAKPHHFVTRELTGSINLYLLTTYGGWGAPAGVVPAENHHYYIEKGSRFEKLETNLVGEYTKRLFEIIQSFVSDSPAILEVLNNNVKLNHSNLLQIIKAYNLGKYTESEKASDSTYVIFFRERSPSTSGLVGIIKNSNLPVETIEITVLNKGYRLSVYDWLEIKVPGNQLIKVCFGNENDNCELISPYEYFTNYFEIRKLKHSGNYGVHVKSKEDAEKILNQLRDIKKVIQIK